MELARRNAAKIINWPISEVSAWVLRAHLLPFTKNFDLCFARIRRPADQLRPLLLAPFLLSFLFILLLSSLLRSFPLLFYRFSACGLSLSCLGVCGYYYLLARCSRPPFTQLLLVVCVLLSLSCLLGGGLSSSVWLVVILVVFVVLVVLLRRAIINSRQAGKGKNNGKHAKQPETTGGNNGAARRQTGWWS